jgi:hypothetical protein
MFTKFYALAAVAATNVLLSEKTFANASIPNDCVSGGSTLGGGLMTSVIAFIGSPVFYFVMFLLALGGLYSAIVKQDTAGWYAVGFAAIGAASPQIFSMIIGFGCNVANNVI